MTDWSAVLGPLGMRPVEEIGSGMEGVVVRLEGDQVVKLWHHKTGDELAVLQSFYADVAGALSLRAPRILDVVRVGERWATVEPLLVGEPMGRTLSEHDVRSLVEVLTALSSVQPSAAMASLPALPGEPPLDVSEGFERGLAALVEHRANDVLAVAVPALPDLVVAVADRLRTLEPAPPGLVHGDLIAANVLVDDGRPSAVLDFGFLTTVGDPTFDAAVTASIVDMYSPAHRSTEERLDQAFGHDPVRVGIYRAAYAVVTATCFSPTGEDGHFAWCAAMLRRPDVLDAVGGRC